MITCQFEDGGKAKLRHVTANAVVVKDGKVLLGKRGTYNGGKPLEEADKWALIGGFLNRDESIGQALKREILEESGWKVDNLQLLHIKDNPDRPHEDRQNIEFVYLAEAVEEVSEHDEEVKELKWFSFDNLPTEEEMAYDHGDDLILYKAYLNKSAQIPYMGKFSR